MLQLVQTGTQYTTELSSFITANNKARANYESKCKAADSAQQAVSKAKLDGNIKQKEVTKVCRVVERDRDTERERESMSNNNLTYVVWMYFYDLSNYSLVVVVVVVVLLPISTTSWVPRRKRLWRLRMLLTRNTRRLWQRPMKSNAVTMRKKCQNCFMYELLSLSLFCSLFCSLCLAIVMTHCGELNAF
jgi:hypothetical protein